MTIFRFLSDLHLHSLCKCKCQCFRIGNLTLTIFRRELIKVELFLNLIDIKESLEKKKVEICISKVKQEVSFVM